jgi:hypothetical protein
VKPRTLKDQIELLDDASREALRALSLVLAMHQASRTEQSEYDVRLDPNSKDQIERAILDLNHAGVTLDPNGSVCTSADAATGKLDADGLVEINGEEVVG